MTITTTDQRPPLVILPELVEADRRRAEHFGEEPLGEDGLRTLVLETTERWDAIRARVELDEPDCGPDDPYQQRIIVWQWNRWVDDDLAVREQAA